MARYTLEEQLAEAKRELTLRHRVYPNLVAKSTLTSVQAERQIGLQVAIIQTLTALCDERGAQVPLFPAKEP